MDGHAPPGRGEEAYALGVGVTGPEMRDALYSDTARASLNGHLAEERWWLAMRNAPTAEALDRAQYADMKIALPGDILTKVDRMSMAVSLEVREPLLDHHLVEFAATLPAHMRVRGSTGKWLMKKTMEGYLDGVLLLFHHRDVPGMIGFIGTIFGRHGVNIAQMTVGRRAPGGEAVGILNLDGRPPEAAVAEVKGHPDITGVVVVFREIGERRQGG